MEDKDFLMKDIEIGTIRKGQVVKATVVSVKDNEISLDLNYMTEGTMYLNEYSLNKINSFKDVVKVGDELDAVVQKISERDDSTLILLSRIPLLKKNSLDKIYEIFKNKEKITVMVEEALHKGVMAKYLGHKIFIHESQLAFDVENKESDKTSFVGKPLEVRITKIDNINNKLVIDASRRVIEKEEFFSERKRLREEKDKLYHEEIDNLNVGDVVEGIIDKVEPYGIIVKFDLIRGLLKLSQLDHKRVTNVAEKFKVGDKITCKVIAKNENKFDLSRKALLPTPHEVYSENHKVGEKVTGRVVQKFPFGTILELEEGITALLHKNEYSWNPNDNFQNNVKIGSLVDVAILSIDPKKEKISVSKKALEDNPWARVDNKVGDIVKVKVADIIPGKALVVEFGSVEGHILISDLAIEKVSKIEALFAIGDEIEAMIVEINKHEWNLRLSIKKLLLKKEEEEYNKFLAIEEKENKENAVTIGDRFKDVLNK